MPADTHISRERIMSTFENVTIERIANVYFNGKVTSRAVIFGNGEKKTLGIMMPVSIASIRRRKN